MKSNKNKKLALLLFFALLCSAFSGCSGQTVSSGGSASSTSSAVSSSSSALTVTDTAFDTEFSGRDLDASYDESTAVFVTLSGSSASSGGSGAAFADGVLTISAEGTYVLSGKLSGQVVVDAPDTAKIQLVLDGAEITNSAGPAIYIKQADKLFLTLADGSQNSAADGESYSVTDGSSTLDGAIFSKADMTINGTGTLNVSGNYKHGIVSKDDLVVTGGTLNVTAKSDALSGKDCVKISDGTFTIQAGSDGIQSSNAEDADKGFVYISGGSFTITAETDGIQAETALEVTGGSFNIAAGGGSANAPVKQETGMNGGGGRFGGTPPNDAGSPPSDDFTPPDLPSRETSSTNTAENVNVSAAIQSSSITDAIVPLAETAAIADDTASAKGLKAGTSLTIGGGTFQIDSADDAVHSNGDAAVTGGKLSISTGDDGIHADNALTIQSGEINIAKSYEGLEGQTVTVNGGTIRLTASDDGLNAAGGNDSSGTQAGGFGKDNFSADANSEIRITGGTLVVNASGDGLDSNGNLVITGGSTAVYGPTNTGNGALDYNGTAQITGGVLAAFGSAGMTQGLGDTSTQCSILHNFDTTAKAGAAFTLTDENGAVIFTVTPEKDYQSVVISTPELTQGKTYTLNAGDQSAQVEQSTVVVSNGGSGGFGGRGGGGGGKGQRPSASSGSTQSSTVN